MRHNHRICFLLFLLLFFFFHHRGTIVFVVCWFFGKVSSRQCEREHSIYGMMLKGHVFKNVTTLSLFFIFRLGLQYRRQLSTHQLRYFAQHV